MQATNADFANKLYGTPEVSTSGRFIKPKLDQTGFTIQHYAGAVTYRTGNFLAKNKDFVVAEHQQLMQNSSVGFVRALFPSEAEETNDKVCSFICSSLKVISNQIWQYTYPCSWAKREGTSCKPSISRWPNLLNTLPHIPLRTQIHSARYLTGSPEKARSES